QTTTDAVVDQAIAQSVGRPNRMTASVIHTPPLAFTPGVAIVIEVKMPGTVSAVELSGRLHYRHLNQAERFQSAPLETGPNGVLRALIPAPYTVSPYPLQYYFEFTTADRHAWLSPGFSSNLTGLPYHVVTATTSPSRTRRSSEAIQSSR